MVPLASSSVTHSWCPGRRRMAWWCSSWAPPGRVGSQSHRYGTWIVPLIAEWFCAQMHPRFGEPIVHQVSLPSTTRSSTNDWASWLDWRCRISRLWLPSPGRLMLPVDTVRRYVSRWTTRSPASHRLTSSNIHITIILRWPACLVQQAP